MHFDPIVPNFTNAFCRNINVSAPTTPMNLSKQSIAAEVRRIRAQWSPAERARRSMVARTRQSVLLRQLMSSAAVA